MSVRYTTPTEEFVIKAIDLTDYQITVSFAQGNTKLNVSPNDVTFDGTDTHIFVSFTQEQSSMFWAGLVRVQINWITEDGYRDATTEAEIKWYGNLLNKVIPNG